MYINSLLLNNTGLNCVYPLICRFFLINTYYSNTWSAIGWIHGCGTVDMKRWQLVTDFLLGLRQGSAPLIPTFFKGQLFIHICAYMLSSVRLCDPLNCSLPGSSVHGISQARILEWVAISSSSESSWPRDQTCISCIGRWIL